MTITVQQAEKILKNDVKFSQLGFSMLVTRLKAQYAKSPSPATIQACAGEMSVFIEKFNKIMSNDYTTIKGL